MEVSYMAILEIGNLYCTLKEVSTRGLGAVDNALAVETPGCTFTPMYRSGKWDGKTRFYEKRYSRFPAGLLSEVTIALKRMGEKVEIVDKRVDRNIKIPKEIKLKHKELGSITLRDYQYESVVKGIEATRGIVNVATNGGKTEIACGIIQVLLPSIKKGERIVFFTHSKEIFTQSHKRLEERLGIKVGMVGNGKWEEEQVTIAMIPTVQKYVKKPKTLPSTKKLKDMYKELELLQIGAIAKKDGYAEKVKEKQKSIKECEAEQWADINSKVSRASKFLKSIVVFIGDEVHHSSSDTWYKVFMSLENSHYRFGLTGTIDKTDEISLKRLYGCTGKIITKVSNDFLIEKGYSAKPTINMLSLEHLEPLVGVPYEDARREGIITHYGRNRAFTDKVEERAKLGKQCLIIVNETEHGEIVLRMLDELNINSEFTHGDKTSKFRMEALDKFRDGTTRVLIATSILDEGVDVSGINCLFLMAGGRSMRQLLQRIGRGLRKKEDGSGLEVYDALDYHNEYLVDHTMERYTTYKDEKFKVVKIM